VPALPAPIRRVFLRAAATGVGSRVFRAVAPRLDRAVGRLTDGRWTVTELIAPTLVLTTTGRRSGLPREQPLLYVDVEDGWAVVGTNWGQAHHPAWTHNLLAEPSATARVRGRTTPVVARLTEGAERDELWRHFQQFGPLFPSYEERIGEDREIRLFVLEPAGS
jgi:deazaflavin-dependent oxidoreductase (nitroreductase family)